MRDIPNGVIYVLLGIYLILLVLQSYLFMDNFTTARAVTGTGQIKLCINAQPEFVLPLSCASSVVVDQQFSCDVDATDPDNDALTFSDNTTLFAIESQTGIISFTPTSAELGQQNFLVTVDDGSPCDNNQRSVVVTVEVTSAAEAPEQPPGPVGAAGGGAGGRSGAATPSLPSTPVASVPSISAPLTPTAPTLAPPPKPAPQAPPAPGLTVPLGKAFEYQTILLETVPSLWQYLFYLLFLFIILGIGWLAFGKKEKKTKYLEKIHLLVLEAYKALEHEDISKVRGVYTELRRVYAKLTPREKAHVHKDILVLYKKIEELVRQ